MHINELNRRVAIDIFGMKLYTTQDPYTGEPYKVYAPSQEALDEYMRENKPLTMDTYMLVPAYAFRWESAIEVARRVKLETPVWLIPKTPKELVELAYRSRNRKTQTQTDEQE